MWRRKRGWSKGEGEGALYLPASSTPVPLLPLHLPSSPFYHAFLYLPPSILTYMSLPHTLVTSCSLCSPASSISLSLMPLLSPTSPFRHTCRNPFLSILPRVSLPFTLFTSFLPPHALFRFCHLPALSTKVSLLPMTSPSSPFRLQCHDPLLSFLAHVSLLLTLFTSFLTPQPLSLL